VELQQVLNVDYKHTEVKVSELRKFESGTKRKPSFLESNSVFFLISSYLILLIEVPVTKSYLALRFEHIGLPMYYIKKVILTSKVHK